jgi:hypothetical protein
MKPRKAETTERFGPNPNFKTQYGYALPMIRATIRPITIERAVNSGAGLVSVISLDVSLVLLTALVNVPDHIAGLGMPHVHKVFARIPQPSIPRMPLISVHSLILLVRTETEGLKRQLWGRLALLLLSGACTFGFSGDNRSTAFLYYKAGL